MFFENHGHTFVKNAMFLTSAKIQRKILMFGETGAPESLCGDWKLNYMIIRPAHFMNIRFILNNARFNNWFKGQR